MQRPLKLCCSLGHLCHPALALGRVQCGARDLPSTPCENWHLSPLSGHHLPQGSPAGPRQGSAGVHWAPGTKISFADSPGGGTSQGIAPVSPLTLSLCPCPLPAGGKGRALTLPPFSCSPSAGDLLPGEGAGPAEAAGHLGRPSHPARGEGALRALQVSSASVPEPCRSRMGPGDAAGVVALLPPSPAVCPGVRHPCNVTFILFIHLFSAWTFAVSICRTRAFPWCPTWACRSPSPTPSPSWTGTGG